MKRLLLSMIFALAGVAAGATPLEDLSRAVDALGRYEVHFSVEMNEESAGEGEYWVDGERFHIDFGGEEIYGDGDLRYTISHTNREVVIERVPSGEESAAVMLFNPSAAFRSLDRYFEADILDESDLAISLRLTPRSEGSMVDESRVLIDRTTNLPISVLYLSEGDVIEIFIIEIAKSTEGVEIRYPAEYEIIDIR